MHNETPISTLDRAALRTGHTIRVPRFISRIAAVGALALATACGSSIPTRQEATTKMVLLDVTGAAASSGKSTKRKSMESYWETPDGNILRCFNEYPIFSDSLGGPTECEAFPVPAQLPPDAQLESMNKGVGQITQSFWEIDDGRLIVCDHEESFWSGNVGRATQCVPFQRPSQVDSKAHLVSANSGKSQEAQTFWENPDGTFTECTHEKYGTGILGLGAKGFDEARGCNTFPIPTDKFPSDVNRPRLVAVNTDDRRPAQSFWQDEGGATLQCIHSKEGFFLGYKQIGKAQYCEYLRPLREVNK